MDLFGPATPRQRDIALAILRIGVGITFCMHGGQKLFVFGFTGVTGAFGQMGIPLPGLTGPLVALVEFFGGLALIIGLLTRLAAFGLAVDMLGAILLVHVGGGFFNPKGFEFPLALFAIALALLVAGGGTYSVDATIARRRERGMAA